MTSHQSHQEGDVSSFEAYGGSSAATRFSSTPSHQASVTECLPDTAGTHSSFHYRNNGRSDHKRMKRASTKKNEVGSRTADSSVCPSDEDEESPTSITGSTSVTEAEGGITQSTRFFPDSSSSITIGGSPTNTFARRGVHSRFHNNVTNTADVANTGVASSSTRSQMAKNHARGGGGGGGGNVMNVIDVTNRTVPPLSPRSKSTKKHTRGIARNRSTSHEHSSECNGVCRTGSQQQCTTRSHTSRQTSYSRSSFEPNLNSSLVSRNNDHRVRTSNNQAAANENDNLTRVNHHHSSARIRRVEPPNPSLGSVAADHDETSVQNAATNNSMNGIRSFLPSAHSVRIFCQCLCHRTSRCLRRPIIRMRVTLFVCLYLALTTMTELGFLNTSFLQPAAKTVSRESPKQMYTPPPLHNRNSALKARVGKERGKKSIYINDNIAITPSEQQKRFTSNEESFKDEPEINKLTSNTNALSLSETNTAIASSATDFKAKEDTQTGRTIQRLTEPSSPLPKSAINHSVTTPNDKETTEETPINENMDKQQHGTTADIVSKKKRKPNLPVYARTSRHHRLVKRTPVYAAVKPQPAAAANHYYHDERKEIGVEEFVNQSSARGGIFLLSSMIFLTAFVFASGSREVHRLWMEASVQLRQQQQEQSLS